MNVRQNFYSRYFFILYS